ncbi:GDSL family lipase [Niastella koreensis]|uniref:GDSL family lipase n=2 Tax=Niastella koreensis TaxID=354356 RepID=G8T736_NIAKG|nr:GDSL-type esterase/lipase family protein [Niastella koreensis]AEV99057.1 GDSL family lipase [Niastella koreensis GR20-10]OQP43971.1 GDSL family lipase [Niastella koreensis]
MTWYENDVKKLEALKGTLPYTPETIFYGSSSIRLWADMYEDLKPLRPINLGFGGSTLAACVWFFDRIMESYSPRHIVIYAGENDLGDGRTPEEVYIFFCQMLACLERRFPHVRMTYISIKPSITRWSLAKTVRYANQLIKAEIDKSNGKYYYLDVFDRMLDANGLPAKDLYDADGLHLSRKGYLIWKDAVSQHFETIFKIS